MAEKSKLRGILEAKCPRCRKGNIFVYPNSKLLKFTATYTNCPHCGLRFEVEPGFFFGAMYISYAMGVGILLFTTFCLYFLFNDPGLLVYIITAPGLVIIFLPFIFRYSRVLYLYLFGGVSYDPRHSHQ